MEFLFEFLAEFGMEMLAALFSPSERKKSKKRIEYYDSQIIAPSSASVFKAMIQHVFETCTKIQFAVHGGLEKIDHIPRIPSDVYKEAFLYGQYGESWNRPCYLYTFKLTPSIKKLLTENECITPSLFYDVEQILLEDATLLKDDEVVITSLSHEGIVKIEKEYQQAFKKHYVKAVKADEEFANVKAQYKKLSLKHRSLWRKKAKTALGDLYAYIANCDQSLFIKPCPHIPMEYDEFIKYINIFMSEKIRLHFADKTSFDQIDYETFRTQFSLELYYLELLIETKF